MWSHALSIIVFSRTHEEEQGISYASSFFTFPLTIVLSEVMTCHVIVRHIFVVDLTIPCIHYPATITSLHY